MVDPQAWAKQRGIAARSTCANTGTFAPLKSWQVKLSVDIPELLRAMQQHAEFARIPIVGGAGMVAGILTIAVGLHTWHVRPVAQKNGSVLEQAQPVIARSVPQPSHPARATNSGTHERGRYPVTAATSLRPSNTTLGLSSEGTIVVVAQPRAGHAKNLNLDITSPNSLWAKAGARYRIDPMLIYAVALVETRGVQPDGSVAPSPWIVRINGHMHSGTREETEHAIELAHLLAVPVQDVGIMQVYYPMHRDIEPDPIALLNPARNIEVGTQLLHKAMRESYDPVLRIGYYHSHDVALARGYGQMVLNVYRELKATVGKPTSGAVALTRIRAEAPGLPAGG